MSEAPLREWFDPLYCSTPLLWINGKQGIGKSISASIILERVKELKDVSVAFFYFAHRDPERDRFVPMARAILSQLLTQNASLLLYFEKMSTSSGQAVLSSRDPAKELLDTALRSRKTYVILDCIDECDRDSRKEICSWFRSFADSLPSAKQDEICSLFIEERFGPLQDRGLDLAKIVPARSQGMFIFAKCVLTELLHQTLRAELLRKWGAENFPTELEEVYSRILRRRMDGRILQQRNITKKLLSWICLSNKRPMRWYEIQAAISIDLENETINETDRRLVDTSCDFPMLVLSKALQRI
ncbi:hypothetical protein B0H67DRAFT_597672 [Lasiosphaeris hirsuta]|uniref:Nephrocystin 3-like N-terminal domain-containing protein n=1 Tax=Lasiosphaeris hirsuta TaxID=260670 RepID=A0AA40BDE5_9PEZI|nr:hypothetical protein B0H67DRAFT_597672 [Lasiosphaeris hirsuta]